ncbi:PC3-like endoprotease variant B [Thelohanellus kitauei]|uniref:PC3-like endoprotease variant B n=1 Tax=Thelohanellus kitauei TaxID=669202 RepID=A0A0C2MUH5_THEKT|nr:PC3-like endoprotease variant B [Thelohanellus kitauei]
MNDTFEGKALSFNNHYIDIYSNSWGPKDDGKSYGKPGPLSEEALKRGVQFGRQGKGCIFVWATGNGGLMDDDCNCDGYVTSIYTIGVGSISDHGMSVYYKESCASTIAVTFSGGSHHERDENKLVTTDIDGQCTDHFRGTSSSAPIASGIFALALEANPKLGWRDIQHLIVHSSTLTSPLDKGWQINGAGHHFNHKFGFGKLDAYNMVQMARRWKNVGPQRICNTFKLESPVILPSNGSLELHVQSDGCKFSPANFVTKLEHVVLRMSFDAITRGSISIGLTSPMKTYSQMLSRRSRDIEETDWNYMTVFNWDESPKGTWIISIFDLSGTSPLNASTTANSTRFDEEDLAREVQCKYDNEQQTPTSSILYMKRFRRDSDDGDESQNQISKIIFKKIELILYGT